jgi:hypothetical protein
MPPTAGPIFAQIELEGLASSKLSTKVWGALPALPRQAREVRVTMAAVADRLVAQTAPWPRRYHLLLHTSAQEPTCFQPLFNLPNTERTLLLRHGIAAKPSVKCCWLPPSPFRSY